MAFGDDMTSGVRNFPYVLILLACLILLSACAVLGQPAPSATPTATATRSPTARPSPTPAPTYTPAATASSTPSPLPTATASATLSPTPSFTPSLTPMLVSSYVFDNWEMVDLPESIKDGIASPLIVFINSNNRVSVANLSTAQPFTGIQTLYFASPTRAHGRIPVLELEAAADLQVFPAPGGQALAYVNADGDPRSSGLYVLDLESGFSARVLPGENPLVQRGFYTAPAWSPAGDQLVMAVATGYDIDIYLYSKDGSGRTNITEHGAYDLWPSWSPDGRHIAFVSDREACPSWIPGDGDFCDALTAEPSRGGQVYLHNIASDATHRVSDAWVTEAPYWIDADELAFASGDPFDLLNPQRRIWRADIETGAVNEIRHAGSPASATYLSEAWSPNGDAVLVHVAADGNRVLLLDGDGDLIGQDSGLDFPRFSMTASWSPDASRMVIGGRAGQCPYGVRVKDNRFGNVARGNPPPTMCDPQFSPDGQFIAFSGVNPRVDGRNDIYVANANGFGAASLTADLRGQVTFVGWIGG